MARQCSGIKRDGGRCTLQVNGKQDFCWAHDPDTADARRKRASKGGKAKASRVTKDLHRLLEELTDKVVSGKLPPYRASVAGQLVRARLSVLEYERNLKETEELEEKVAALEQLAEATSRPRRRQGWQDGIG